jgi:hypothetical protein
VHKQIIAAAATTLLAATSAAACGFNGTSYTDLGYEESYYMADALLTGPAAGTDSPGEGDVEVQIIYDSGIATINLFYDETSGPHTHFVLDGPNRDIIAIPPNVEIDGLNDIKACFTLEEVREVIAGQWDAVVVTAKYPNGELRGTLK